VRNADLVLFMEHGHVIEAGSFLELSARNGRFAAALRAGGLLEAPTLTLPEAA
jgi:ATP-binding cassette subfamily B protein